MNRLVKLSLFTTAKPSFILKTQRGTTACLGNQSRSLATNIATEESVQMEESMNKIEELFAAAKDELEYAEESQGTTYYHEDRTAAEKAVNETLEAFDNFLKELPSDDMRNEVQQKVGMKMRELKMTFDNLPEEGH